MSYVAIALENSALSPVELNSNLEYREGPYYVLLPVCKVCLQNDCNIIVRATRQNALAKQARIDVEATKEVGRQEHDIVAAVAMDSPIAAPTPVATPFATPIATPVATTAPRPNTTKRTSTRCMFIPTLASPFLFVDALASL